MESADYVSRRNVHHGIIEKISPAISDTIVLGFPHGEKGRFHQVTQL